MARVLSGRFGGIGAVYQSSVLRNPEHLARLTGGRV